VQSSNCVLSHLYNLNRDCSYFSIVLGVYLLDFFELRVIFECEAGDESNFKWFEGEDFFSYDLNVVGGCDLLLVECLLGLVQAALVVFWVVRRVLA
jgi:hypothetical protein